MHLNENSVFLCSEKAHKDRVLKILNLKNFQVMRVFIRVNVTTGMG